MDANKFMSEFGRICDSYDRCSDCPLGQGRRICSYYPSHYTQEIISAAIKTVEEWSAAHPCKTRQSVFLKQWPETEIDVNGVLQLCPMSISAAHRDTNGECKNPTKRCSDCQREFWMQEVE